ncbi:hypothetical protein J0B02_00535 [Enterobacteriaceae bacterium YMB-R22]|uniref:DNA-binding protein n=1 Tax=Tenebrionicola larvae TaxID=2815733 RepID=UPI0020130F7F|nr:DNA-binding protein [Tenebrionicola larvae]MBV4411345.1 hypothetical protein [Tenebrionicola larvae]
MSFDRKIKTNFLYKEKSMPIQQQQKEWVTTQECLGIPGFPGTPANVRKKLDLLATGNPALKRKREGTKAYEYHVSLLPALSQAYFGVSGERLSQHPLPEVEVQEHEFWWKAIYRALSKEEIALIITSFKNSGKHGIFLQELLEAASNNFSSLSRTSIQTALVLEALSEEDRKEILAKYGISEQGRPVAPEQEPHKTRKKAG